MSATCFLVNATTESPSYCISWGYEFCEKLNVFSSSEITNNMRVYIKVPHGSSSYVTWKDPTHKRGMFITSFAYFDDRYQEGAFFGYYAKAKFRIEKARLNFSIHNPWGMSLPRRIMNQLVHVTANSRSEERRVGKECRSRW